MKNSVIKIDSLPPLIADMLHDQSSPVDNLFADAWKELGFNTLIKRCGFSKRSGTDIVTVVYLLMVWRWMYVVVSLFNRWFAPVKVDHYSTTEYAG